MEKEIFTITEQELFQLKATCFPMEKNRNIEYFALEIAKRFFKKKFPDIEFGMEKDVDLCFTVDKKKFEYGIKGTTNCDITWGKWKIASKSYHDKLENGMPMIMITHIGTTTMTIYILKYGEDFTLEQESKWNVYPSKYTIGRKNVKNPPIEEVREFIRQQILNAKKTGSKELVLQSGEIHAQLSMDNALPTVCAAMKSLGANYTYEIEHEPPKGMGTRLFIKYKL